MVIKGGTKVYGLIGNPVEHTVSPLIHNTLADRLGLDFVYVPFRVEDPKTAVKGAYALNLQGMNVTVPHKSAVLEWLADCDELAAKIGSVNTLVRQEEGFKGYNTDLTGLYRAMESEGIPLEKEKVIILGAGGAARAVAFLCASRKAEQIYLLNRSLDKAETIAAEIRSVFGRDCVIPMKTEEYALLPKEKMLCIQATSVGLAPDVEAVVLEAPDFYERIHTGYDLIYRPCDTRFMQLVRKAGGRAFHGLKMLLYQGIEAFELWTGIAVGETLVQEVYGKMKEEMGIEE